MWTLVLHPQDGEKKLAGRSEKDEEKKVKPGRNRRLYAGISVCPSVWIGEWSGINKSVINGRDLFRLGNYPNCKRIESEELKDQTLESQYAVTVNFHTIAGCRSTFCQCRCPPHFLAFYNQTRFITMYHPQILVLKCSICQVQLGRPTQFQFTSHR